MSPEDMVAGITAIVGKLRQRLVDAEVRAARAEHENGALLDELYALKCEVERLRGRAAE